MYGSGRSVVIRSIADPLKAELYSEHAKDVTVAKMSPSGFYVASGDGELRVKGREWRQEGGGRNEEGRNGMAWWRK